MANNHVDNNPDWSDTWLPQKLQERFDIDQDDDVDLKDGAIHLGIKGAVGGIKK